MNDEKCCNDCKLLKNCSVLISPKYQNHLDEYYCDKYKYGPWRFVGNGEWREKEVS